MVNATTQTSAGLPGNAGKDKAQFQKTVRKDLHLEDALDLTKQLDIDEGQGWGWGGVLNPAFLTQFSVSRLTEGRKQKCSGSQRPGVGFSGSITQPSN